MMVEEDQSNFIQNKFGYCFYVVDDDDHSALIYNLFVHPIYRKQGNAKNLLKLVINQIRESGYDKEIRIEAIPRENSISTKDLICFYERLGLQILTNPEDS